MPSTGQMAQGKESEHAGFPLRSDRLKASVVKSKKAGRKRGKERGGEIQQIQSTVEGMATDTEV